MNKYNAKKVTVDGVKYDSKKEYSRYCELKLLERTGAITDLKRQQRYELIPKQGKERACTYIADFVYTENGETIVEDVKGYRGSGAYSLFVIKRKLMLYRYGIQIHEI